MSSLELVEDQLNLVKEQDNAAVVKIEQKGMRSETKLQKRQSQNQKVDQIKKQITNSESNQDQKEHIDHIIKKPQIGEDDEDVKESFQQKLSKNGLYNYLITDSFECPLNNFPEAELQDLFKSIPAGEDKITFLKNSQKICSYSSAIDRLNYLLRSVQKLLKFIDNEEQHKILKKVIDQHLNYGKKQSAFQIKQVFKKDSLQLHKEISFDTKSQKPDMDMSDLFDFYSNTSHSIGNSPTFQRIQFERKVMDMRNVTTMMKTSFSADMNEIQRCQFIIQSFRKLSVQGRINYKSFLEFCQKLGNRIYPQLPAKLRLDKIQNKLIQGTKFLKPTFKRQKTSPFLHTPHTGKLPGQIKEQLQLRRQKYKVLDSRVIYSERIESFVK